LFPTGFEAFGTNYLSVISPERIDMEQWKGLPLGRQLILGAGVLLFIDTFLSWQKVSVHVAGITTVSASQSAWHGFWGVVLALLTLVLVAWAVVRVLGIELKLPVPEAFTALAIAGVIVLFALIKVLSDDYVHWPAWVGLILAIVVAVGAWLTFQESGEAMPNFSAMTSGSGSGSNRPEASTPPPSAAAEPEAQPEVRPDAPAGTDPV
jgi:hypothetical protein